jgi:hypothetical protein
VPATLRSPILEVDELVPGPVDEIGGGVAVGRGGLGIDLLDLLANPINLLTYSCVFRFELHRTTPSRVLVTSSYTRFFVAVKILIDSPASLIGRVEVAAAGRAQGSARFRSRAVIPKGNWSRIDRAVASRLHSTHPRYTDVAVVRPPEGLVSDRDRLAAWSLGLGGGNGWRALPLRAERPSNLPGVTTRAKRDGPYIGIHVDSFDGAPLRDRHLSRNRLCINLGSECRYLLFLETTIQELGQATGHEEVWPNYADDISTDSAIIRMRIDPGEGYLAPTELLLHDGQAASNALDITMTYLAHFHPASFTRFLPPR